MSMYFNTVIVTLWPNDTTLSFDQYIFAVLWVLL